MGRRMLVVEDDASSARLLEAFFSEEGFTVGVARNGKVGLEHAARDRPDIVLLDLNLPELDGMEVLARLQKSQPGLPVLMLTANTDVKTAVRAVQLGAYDYLTKPLDLEEIQVVVLRALETRALRQEVEELRRQVGEGGGLAQQMGSSPEIARVIEQVKTVAASDFSVLILGETGIGKELVAQAIHRQSERRARSFVALDCGAIPESLIESELFGHEKGAFTGAERRKEGRFHLAEGGTLFLDEVGNLPLGLQAKLLRVLESRQLHAVGSVKATALDVRFVAATNETLQEHATTGRFRADLYFRLAQYTIHLPALRARVADIPELARRFMEEASVELRRPLHEIDTDAIASLQKYAWPGNVRELRNVMRQAVLESKTLVLRSDDVQRFLGRPGAALPGGSRSGPGRSLREAAEAAAREAERQIINETLLATRGNKSQAARALSTDYKTLHLKMKTLGIRAKDFSP
ncbi:MAG TPA: sigma-54 dependent transcriptional regulator [Polyangiaceae bacterium]